MINKIKAIIKVCFLVKKPLASGLVNFIGWYLSFSTSRTSLTIYMMEQAKQKEEKRMNKSYIVFNGRSKILPEKKAGINIIPFLIQ
ncbi:hypothetical protein SAMN05216357_115110 [Porphyromonadaceae bacterium KH3CP3RA]|nr:hypothetical protein SAMN05216357_115110 [Porphyromonadaceae bacterium KH3CP3RA]